MNRFNWTTEIEEQIAKGVEEPKNEAEFHKLWDKFRLVIETSTTRNCQIKQIPPHSKPYWTEELSAIPRKMRKALKSYLTGKRTITSRNIGGGKKFLRITGRRL